MDPICHTRKMLVHRIVRRYVKHRATGPSIRGCSGVHKISQKCQAAILAVGHLDELREMGNKCQKSGIKWKNQSHTREAPGTGQTPVGSGTSLCQ